MGQNRTLAAENWCRKCKTIISKAPINGQKSAFFCPKPQYNVLKTAKWREIVATLHMQLDFRVSKGLLRPSNATIYW